MNYTLPPLTIDDAKRELTRLTTAIYAMQADLSPEAVHDSFDFDALVVEGENRDEGENYNVMYDLLGRVAPPSLFTSTSFPRPLPNPAEAEFAKSMLPDNAQDMSFYHDATQRTLKAFFLEAWIRMQDVNGTYFGPDNPYNRFHAIREELGIAKKSPELYAFLNTTPDEFARTDMARAFETINDESQQLPAVAQHILTLRRAFGEKTDVKPALLQAVKQAAERVEFIMTQSDISQAQLQTYITATTQAVDQQGRVHQPH